MRVLFINTVFGRGSTGRIISDLGSMLKENGHEFTVAYGRGESNNPNCFRIGCDIGLYLHAGLSRITDKAGFYSKHATQKLIEFINEYNPDIIHLHNLHGYYLNIKILFRYLSNEYKGRVIWTLHDCWAFTGHCVHYTYVRCNQWKTGCQKCPEKKRYPKSLLCDNSRRNFILKQRLFTAMPSLTIVTPSIWLQEQVKQSFLKKYSVYVINNGVDLSLFSRMPNMVEKGFLLNVTDGYDERKGYDDLLKLREKLPKEYMITIVGVKKKAKENIEGIKVVGRTDSIDELVKYYNRAEILLNPTYEDTFPTVNMEALACGLPVITYDAGGSPEVIDKTCGAIVKPGDIEEFCSTIVANCWDRDACYAKSKQYDKNIKYKEYLLLYEKVLKESSYAKR